MKCLANVFAKFSLSENNHSYSTQTKWQNEIQLSSNPDFVNCDLKMFSRVWHSIESLCVISGLKKNYAREVGVRSVLQYQISPNFLFFLACLVELKKSTITLKYTTDVARICEFSK